MLDHLIPDLCNIVYSYISLRFDKIYELFDTKNITALKLFFNNHHNFNSYLSLPTNNNLLDLLYISNKKHIRDVYLANIILLYSSQKKFYQGIEFAIKYKADINI